MLRPMVAADAKPLLAIFGDPSVMASFDAAPFDRSQMDRWVARNLQHQQLHGYGLFTVIELQGSLVIGDCGLELMEDQGVVELGYDLRADRWGQGLATEAASAVCDHAFKSLGLPRLISLVRETNLASQRVAEKIGMRHERNMLRFGARYRRYGIEVQNIGG
jgi:RimJ/RimL family protein N-acetyltransferase